MDDVYVSYEELKPGDIFLGTTRNRNWSDGGYLVTRCDEGRVYYRHLRNVDIEIDYSLWNDPGRKYRLKQSMFKYDPEQTGDTEDDI